MPSGAVHPNNNSGAMPTRLLGLARPNALRDNQCPSPRSTQPTTRGDVNSSPGTPASASFSAAYRAAASFTIGAISASSALYQSDVIFQFLPSQVWMRPVRAPS